MKQKDKSGILGIQNVKNKTKCLGNSLKTYKKKNKKIKSQMLDKSCKSVAQSVECATPDEEVVGSITNVAARSLLVGSVSV